MVLAMVIMILGASILGGGLMGLVAGLLANPIDRRLEEAANQVRRAAGVPLCRCARVLPHVRLTVLGMWLGLAAPLVHLRWHVPVPGVVALMALVQALAIGLVALRGRREIRSAHHEAATWRPIELPPELEALNRSGVTFSRIPSPPPDRP